MTTRRHRARALTSVALISGLLGVGGTLLFPTGSDALDRDTQEIEVSAVGPQEKLKWARATKVSLADAIRTALARTPGLAIQATLESLKGRLIYEIEIVTADGAVVEVFVDPQTGNIIDSGGTK
ncbi:MAG: PepSY domain-containing protein [Nitrospiraceae bacterium]|nr:PepSY domain-containing protein [Nitrospiraceae bacterium]